MSAKGSAKRNVRRSPRAPRTDCSRKRPIQESPVVPEPKRKCYEKKSQDGRFIDKYCWICHKLGQDEKCFTCPRVYHSECLKNGSHAFTDKGVCPECQLDSVDGTELSKTLTHKRLKELLLATMKRRMGYENSRFARWPHNIEGDELVWVCDFQVLDEKIKDIVPYTKTSEFFSDVKWILHNCFILCGGNSKVTESAIKLVKEFKADLLDLEACHECYYHLLCTTTSDFVRVCDTPHDIIWAKMGRWPYWPAKCLKVVNNRARLRFFGKHEIGNVPISQCYFISKEHPCYPYKSVPKTPKYAAALMELRRYVGLYEKTFGVGSFHYYPEKTPFKPEDAVPKPTRYIPQETDPVSRPTKPKIANMPICVNFSDGSDEPSTSNAIPMNSSNAVAVSMTFSAEDDQRTNEDLASTSMDSTYDAPIDIQSRTATTVVTSTPVVTATDSLINLGSDNLSLGAEFSNSNLVHESDNEVNANNLDSTSSASENTLETFSNTMNAATERISPLRLSQLDFIRQLNSVGNFSGTVSQRSITGKDDVVLETSDSQPASASRSHVDEQLIVSYLTSHGKKVNTNASKEFRTVLYTLFVNMWTLAHNAPAAPEILTTVISDLKKHQEKVQQLQTENENLKHVISSHRGVIAKLHKDISSLKRSVEKEKRKNEDTKMEFNDATRNAKLVVDSLKSSSDKFWTTKLKEVTASLTRKLDKQDATITEYKERLEAVQAKLDMFEKQSKDSENIYENARSELDSMLKENSRLVQRDMEQKLCDQIVQAKRDTFCYACLKPAKIHCCISANYCSKTCLKRHLETHAKVCQKPKKPRLEVEVPQIQQFPNPMINQLNPSQTFARKTTSIHLQFEQSSNIVTTTHTEPNLYIYPPLPSTSAFNAMYAAALEANDPINMPLNLTQNADRYAIRPALLPPPSSAQSLFIPPHMP